MRHIILVMSDQHNGRCISLQDQSIRTPNLERIAKEGRYYPHAYCNAPLCVPSRMSFLAGAYPSELQIFNNDTTLPVDMPTLAHTLGSIGYRTVLIGRMHFKGEEQHHGFDERYVGDITSQYWGTGGKQRTDFEGYAQSTNRLHCLQAVGGGVSPVMVYDQMVYEEAMKFLETPQPQPLFLVIGFYGPHFPYTCEASKFAYYRQHLEADEQHCANEVYKSYLQSADATLQRDCKASYYGLVETLDQYIGALYDQVKTLEEPAYFLYTSDHGEQYGKRHIFGKQTLYEDAISIPLLVSGEGIVQGVDEKTVSLLDVSTTIACLAGCQEDDGNSILTKNKEAWIRSEVLLNREDGSITFGQCVIRWPYKAVSYDQQSYLYHLQQDPEECQDIKEQAFHIFQQLKQHFVQEEQQQSCITQERIQRKRHETLKAWGLRKKPEESSSVRIPSHTLQDPIR